MRQKTTGIVESFILVIFSIAIFRVVTESIFGFLSCKIDEILDFLYNDVIPIFSALYDKKCLLVAICVTVCVVLIIRSPFRIKQKKRKEKEQEQEQAEEERAKREQQLYRQSLARCQVEITDGMTGTQFEQWCADLLMMLGYKNISITKGSGDQGVDIIAEMDGIKYAIQCKCYSKPLGNKPIQEVNAGMVYYGCDVGAVMTNNYFTSGGKQLARATGVHLWDRNYLINQIDRLNEFSQIEEDTKKPKKVFVYQDGGTRKMEKGLWPHKYAADIDIEYFKALPRIGYPDCNVTGIPRFPGIDPHELHPESIIVVETIPFDDQSDAELFSKYAERHFYAKTWVEPRDGKYFTFIQTHVYSVMSNYWEDEGHYIL